MIFLAAAMAAILLASTVLAMWAIFAGDPPNGAIDGVRAWKE